MCSDQKLALIPSYNNFSPSKTDRCANKKSSIWGYCFIDAVAAAIENNFKQP